MTPHDTALPPPKNVYFRSPVKSTSDLKPEVFWNSEVPIFGRETQCIYCMLLAGQCAWDLGQELVIKHTYSSATGRVFTVNKIKARKSQRKV